MKLKCPHMLTKLYMSMSVYEIKWDNTVAMATGTLTSYIPLLRTLLAAGMEVLRAYPLGMGLRTRWPQQNTCFASKSLFPKQFRNT
jgi:hypothetical protein